MVSFCCDRCQDIVKKPQAMKHVYRCKPSSISCVDCYKTFYGHEFQAHTSCITEKQKYHGEPINKQWGKKRNHAAQSHESADKQVKNEPVAKKNKLNPTSANDVPGNPQTPPLSPETVVMNAVRHLELKRNSESMSFKQLKQSLVDQIKVADPSLSTAQAGKFVKQSIRFIIQDEQLRLKFAP